MPGLSPKTISLVQSSGTYLKEHHGNGLATAMYDIMLNGFPFVKDMCNQSHQIPDEFGTTDQARSLAASVFAYVEHLENLGALTDAVEMMVEKHVSAYVLPEHYPVVGECLLKAIRQCLGEERATDEVVQAWTEAYWFLADILVAKETERREARGKEKGGWVGYRRMNIVKKEEETSEITSFYFKPEDEGPIKDFRPGQYIGVSLPKSCDPSWKHDMVRNYSISCPPGRGYYRVSMRREDGDGNNKPRGIISNYFLTKLDVGDTVMMSIPSGSFFLRDPESDHPLFFLSAGVGLTPLLSMLEHTLATRPKRPVTLVQAVTEPKMHLKRKMLDEFADPARGHDLTLHVFYSSGNVTSPDDSTLRFTNVHSGRLDKARLAELANGLEDKGEFYVVGPTKFMASMTNMLLGMGVAKGRVHSERFGPEVFD